MRVSDGYQTWSDSFDREITDVFAVQTEIARAVVAALQLRMEAGGALALERPPTAPEAYRYYLLGKQRHRAGGQSAEMFEKALQLDPAYAPAWAGLASAIAGSAQGERETMQARSERFSRALEAAGKAVALAPGLPDGYEARGHVRTFLWDWRGARADVESAVALDPGRSLAHRRYGAVLFAFGEGGKAVEHLRRSVELDPLEAPSWSALGYAYLVEGNLDEARKASLRTLELVPDGDAPTTLWNLGEIELHAGRPAEALAIFERNRLEWHRMLGRILAHHDLGHDRESREALAALTDAYGGRDSYLVAAGHAWRGELDAAFQWLDRAVAEHAAGVWQVQGDLRFRKLRGDPRFAALLRKMNLPVRPP